MSAPEAPENNDLEIARMERKAENRAAKRERRDEKKEQQRLDALRTGAIGNASSSAANYFLDEGIDPTEYMDEIDQAIRDIMGGVSLDDPAPGAYLKNVGQEVFDREQDLKRRRALTSLDDLFSDDFDTDRIANEIDDAILSAIYEEERGKASDILSNMLNRGVITNTGYQSGVKDLDRQSPAARARLTTLGDAELARGRTKLRDVVNKGRSTASTLRLGQNFDANEYSSNVDKEFDTWLAGLGDSLRAVAPSDLFATGSLASTAGQGQGAQNTKFDPKALSGIIDDEEEEEEDETPESVF